MQYKIPVQIENEDPIIFGLGLRQLAIIMTGFGISYSLFTSMAPNLGIEVALIPSVLIFLISVTIAIFKYYEMTFVPFILAFIRFKSNIEERKWIKGVDGFQPMDIGYVSSHINNNEKKIDFTNKIDKMKNIEDKLKNI